MKSGKIKGEDIAEFVFSMLLVGVIFLVYVGTGINPILHETGHQWTCHNMGGRYMVKEMDTGSHVTQCRDIPQNTSNFQILLFYISGIGVELVVGSIILFVPMLFGFLTRKASPTGLIAPFGAFVIAKVGFNLLKGHYGPDLARAAELNSIFGFFLTPLGIILSITASLGVLVLSVYDVWHIVRKLDIRNI